MPTTPKEWPRFDVSFWCQQCFKVVALVYSVADNNPGDRLEDAMREHLITEHPLPICRHTV